MIRRVLLVLALSGLTSLAFATPALPSATIASQAVRTALATPDAPRQTAATTPAAAAPSPATLRAAGVAQASQSTVRRATGSSAVVRSTAYNSTTGQTDSTPFVTATGTRVRFGTVALSRDLLRQFPYGTRVTLDDLSGRYSALLRGRVFVVEDTMHPRMANTVDVWMGSRSEALAWGKRTLRITALR
jgi:3D (Asp-Asp-Asp) domain-containing protein